MGNKKRGWLLSGILLAAFLISITADDASAALTVSGSVQVGLGERCGTGKTCPANAACSGLFRKTCQCKSGYTASGGACVASCTPSCTGDRCGQSNGCGGTCPSDDKSSCGKCGNAACCIDNGVTCNYDNACDSTGNNNCEAEVARCARTVRAVNGGWSGWSACSAACGGGTQTATCSNPGPSCEGSECGCPAGATCGGSGSGKTATTSCNTQACPPACTPSDEACDGRDNDCDGSNDEGAVCGYDFNKDGCVNENDVNELWAYAGQTVSGDRGKYDLDGNKAINYDDAFKLADHTNIVEGNWGEWSCGNWGACSAACGGGSYQRSCTRRCNNPSPSCGGPQCLRNDSTTGDSETKSESGSCNTQACCAPASSCSGRTITWSGNCVNGRQSGTCSDGCTGTLTASDYCRQDFSRNYCVGMEDFDLFKQAFGGADTRFDLSRNGKVEFDDFFLFVDAYGSGCSAPQPQPIVTPSVSFSASSASINLGSDVILTWATQGLIASCSAAGEWTGVKSVGGGSEAAKPSSTGQKTYTISCLGSRGELVGSKSVAVEVACSALSHKEGSVCAANACASSTPNYATLCSNDDTQVPSHNTANTVVDACTSGVKCEYTCNANYHREGNQCVLNSCSAQIPNYATLCSNDGTQVPSHNTASTVVDSCTSGTKCEYTCNPSYHREGNQCVLNSCSAQIPNYATLCSNDATQVASHNTASTVVDACTSGVKCEYTCNANYHREGASCVGNTRECAYTCSNGAASASGRGSQTWMPAQGVWGACSQSCSSCNAGYFRNGVVCSQCAAGTYSTAGTTAASCTSCPAGYTSNAGSASCNLCAAGYHSIGSECVQDDTAAPAISSATPASGAVASSSVLLSAVTNEKAACRYHTIDAAYASMANALAANAAGTAHTATISLNPSAANNYYIRCRDVAGNAMPSSVSRSYSVDQAAPTTSSPSPSGTNTSTAQTISIATNEAATCKYSTTDVSYDAMYSNEMQTSGERKTHTKAVTARIGGNTYYVRCMDSLGNKMPASSIITFTVNNAPAVSRIYYAGNCVYGGTIYLKCNASDADQAANTLTVKGWLGTCAAGNCFNTRSFTYFSDRQLAVAAGTAGTFQSTGIVLSHPVGTPIAATCRAKDSLDADSAWADSYPICTVNACANNPAFTITFPANPVAAGTANVQIRVAQAAQGITLSSNPTVSIASIGAAAFDRSPSAGTYLYSISIPSSLAAGNYDVQASGSTSQGCTGSSLGILTVSRACNGTAPTGPSGSVTSGPLTYTSGSLNWAYDAAASASTPCKWRCNQGYHPNGNSCELNSRTKNATDCTNGVAASCTETWTNARDGWSTCTPSGCSSCNINYHIEGNQCIHNADFNSNGRVDMDDFFLFADNFNKPVSAANLKFDMDNNNKIDFDDFFRFSDYFGTGLPSAETLCGASSHREGSGCAPNACSSQIPNYATLCSNDGTQVASHNTANTVVDSCTSGVKCEYTCNPSYHREGNQCVLNSCSAQIPNYATLCSNDGTQVASHNTANTVVDSCTSSAKCEYTCQSGYYRLENRCIAYGDFDKNGCINFDDFFLFADNFGSTNRVYDLNNDGRVNFDDFFRFSDVFGAGCAAPQTGIQAPPITLTPDPAKREGQVQVGHNLTYKIDSNDAAWDFTSRSQETCRVAKMPRPATFNVAGLRQGACSVEIINPRRASAIVLIPILNSPPSFDAISDKAVSETHELVFTVSANDINRDRLAYSAANLPRGAVFNPSARTFSWTPGFDDAGDYKITFSVSDGFASASITVNLRVDNRNRKPEANAGGPYSQGVGRNLILNGAASDPDRDLLSYSWDLQEGCRILKEGSTLKPAINCNQSGTYNITLTVDDGHGNRSTSYALANIWTWADGGACMGNNYCISEYCNPNKICSTPSCQDGWKNQDEQDADCGGSCADGCRAGKIESQDTASALYTLQNNPQTCANLGYGQKCEVTWDVAVNAPKGSRYLFDVEFKSLGGIKESPEFEVIFNNRTNITRSAGSASASAQSRFPIPTGRAVSAGNTGGSSPANLVPADRCRLVSLPAQCGCPEGMEESAAEPGTCVEPREDCIGDFDGDGKVDYSDFFMFTDKFGKRAIDSGWNAAFNLNDEGSSDDSIDFDDFFAFADWFGRECDVASQQCSYSALISQHARALRDGDAAAAASIEQELRQCCQSDAGNRICGGVASTPSTELSSQTNSCFELENREECDSNPVLIDDKVHCKWINQERTYCAAYSRECSDLPMMDCYASLYCMWDGKNNVCTSRECQGTIPTGEGVVLGPGLYEPGGNKYWSYRPSAYPEACQWNCRSGYTMEGHGCVVDSSYRGNSIVSTSLISGRVVATGEQSCPGFSVDFTGDLLRFQRECPNNCIAEGGISSALHCIDPPRGFGGGDRTSGRAESASTNSCPFSLCDCITPQKWIEDRGFCRFNKYTSGGNQFFYVTPGQSNGCIWQVTTQIPPLDPSPSMTSLNPGICRPLAGANLEGRRSAVVAEGRQCSNHGALRQEGRRCFLCDGLRGWTLIQEKSVESQATLCESSTRLSREHVDFWTDRSEEIRETGGSFVIPEEITADDLYEASQEIWAEQQTAIEEIDYQSRMAEIQRQQNEEKIESIREMMPQTFFSLGYLIPQPPELRNLEWEGPSIEDMRSLQLSIEEAQMDAVDLSLARSLAPDAELPFSDWTPPTVERPLTTSERIESLMSRGVLFMINEVSGEDAAKMDTLINSKGLLAAFIYASADTIGEMIDDPSLGSRTEGIYRQYYSYIFSDESLSQMTPRDIDLQIKYLESPQVFSTEPSQMDTFHVIDDSSNGAVTVLALQTQSADYVDPSQIRDYFRTHRDYTAAFAPALAGTDYIKGGTGWGGLNNVGIDRNHYEPTTPDGRGSFYIDSNGVLQVTFDATEADVKFQLLTLKESGRELIDVTSQDEINEWRRAEAQRIMQEYPLRVGETKEQRRPEWMEILNERQTHLAEQNSVSDNAIVLTSAGQLVYVKSSATSSGNRRNYVQTLRNLAGETGVIFRADAGVNQMAVSSKFNQNTLHDTKFDWAKPGEFTPVASALVIN